MKIESSALQMQAQHVATRVHTQTTRLDMWVGDRRPAAGPPRTPSGAADVQISRAGRAAAAAPAERRRGDDDEHNSLTPRLAMLRDLIERLTGRAVRVYGDTEAPPPAAADAAPPAQATPATSTPTRPRAGFGLVYEHHEVLEETEHTRFTAQGTVRTADGQEIAFSVQLDMQRSYREESFTRLRLGDAVAVDPLVINFDGSAAELQDLRFAFDLDGDGSTEDVPLLQGQRGYLALDSNGNQRIDSGLELFGPGTGNGFAELARHDSDGNGWIDAADPAFGQLRVWTPQAQGGGSLQSLQAVGVGAIQLASAATPFALRNADNRSLGAIRATGVYLRADGGAGTVQQIDLNV